MITIKTLLILCFILAILYLYAIIWVLVGFSSISISTGEWKPRGLYLDETSIQHMNWLHSHSISDQWHVYSPVENKVTNQSICLELSKKNFSSSSTLFVPTDCKRYEWNNHSVDFYEITITPVYKLIDSDIIVLVITYFHKDELFIRNILSQLVSVYSYHTPWLSKRIIILLLSINHHFTEDESENNSNMVDFNPYISWWLRNYHADSYFLSSNNHPSPTNHFHKQNVINQGIIREAYIINFCHNMTTNNKSISKNQSIYSWDHIGLYTIGRNGQQPNMDIVSLLLLSTDSKNIVLSEKYEIIKETLTFIFKYIGLSNIAKNMEKGYIMDKQIWLLSYWLDMIYQRPGNDLHSLFLERNIDSITIQPQSYGEKNIISEIDLFGMIEKLIHSSSLLQEELHHSHFYYLLLGKSNFVGIGEYLPSLGLLVFPLLILYFILSSSHSSTNSFTINNISQILFIVVFGWIYYSRDDNLFNFPNDIIIKSFISSKLSLRSLLFNISFLLPKSLLYFIDNLCYDKAMMIRTIIIIYTSFILIHRINFIRFNIYFKSNFFKDKSHSIDSEINSNSNHQFISVSITLLIVVSLFAYIGIQNIAVAFTIAVILVPIFSAIGIFLLVIRIYKEKINGKLISINRWIYGVLYLMEFILYSILLTFGINNQWDEILNHMIEIKSLTLYSVIIFLYLLSSTFRAI